MASAAHPQDFVKGRTALQLLELLQGQQTQEGGFVEVQPAACSRGFRTLRPCKAALRMQGSIGGRGAHMCGHAHDLGAALLECRQPLLPRVVLVGATYCRSAAETECSQSQLQGH